METTARQQAGSQAENLALDYLQRQKLALVTRNFHVRGGELDLVMLDDATLVFIEVRQRAARGLVSAAESVDGGKQRRLIHAAQCFLASHPQHARRPCRFDVVAIAHNLGERRLEWRKNAFEASAY
ncbi:MAG: YraN family protein [Pseudomonadota bacterium]